MTAGGGRTEIIDTGRSLGASIGIVGASDRHALAGDGRAHFVALALNSDTGVRVRHTSPLPAEEALRAVSINGADLEGATAISALLPIGADDTRAGGDIVLADYSVAERARGAQLLLSTV